MPIRCTCPNGHPLRVQEALAGKEGVCPECGARFTIPSPPQASSATSPAPHSPVPPSPQPAAEGPEAAVEWRLASPEGDQFGPTVTTLFAQWIKEGKVQPDWLVWRTGWEEWRTAALAEKELPAPLQGSPPPLPISTESAAPLNIDSERQPHTDDGYLARRRRAARRRKLLAIVLAVAVVAMLGVLAWLMLSPQ